MRTALAPAWVDSIAFALLSAQEHRDHDAQAALTSRLYDATSGFRNGFNLVHADLAEAVGRLITAVYPAGSRGLEFRSMDTGEQVDPELFTGTEDGAATVWAARTVSAACSGDPVMVEALADLLLDQGDVAIAKGLRMLLHGAAAVLADGHLRMDWAALEAQAAGASPPDYVGECTGRDHLGRQIVAPCAVWHRPDRALRDRLAARHVITTGHTITLKEE